MSIIKHKSKLLVIVLLTLMLAACNSGTSSNAGTASSGVATVVDGKINLNNMSEDQLMNTIPNFSSRMVREFFEYQPYISIQQFRREIGKYVDEAQVAAYEQYVFVPVNVDESDAETLQQIPGINESIAAELMAARPYNSNEAFLTKLASYLSEAETAAAATYLQ